MFSSILILLEFNSNNLYLNIYCNHLYMHLNFILNVNHDYQYTYHIMVLFFYNLIINKLMCIIMNGVNNNITFNFIYIYYL